MVNENYNQSYSTCLKDTRYQTVVAMNLCPNVWHKCQRGTGPVTKVCFSSFPPRVPRNLSQSCLNFGRGLCRSYVFSNDVRVSLTRPLPKHMKRIWSCPSSITQELSIYFLLRYYWISPHHTKNTPNLKLHSNNTALLVASIQSAQSLQT